MKRIASTYILLLLPLLIFSQVNQSFCKTDSDLKSIASILKYKKQYADGLINESKSMTRYIPLKFTILGDDDGKGYIEEKDIFNLMCPLNEIFAQVGVVFYLDEKMSAAGPSFFNYINNTLMFDDPLNSQSRPLFLDNKADDAINIFLVNESSPSFLISSTYSGSGDYILATETAIQISLIKGFAHQLGHFFKLMHTYSGTEAYCWDPSGSSSFCYTIGDTLPPFNTTGQELETVDRANCDSAGDFLCDTQAEYGHGFLSSDCEDEHLVYDYKGDALDADELNLMSSFNNCSTHEFSLEQENIMFADYLDPSRDYIRRDTQITDVMITDFVNVLAPQQAEELNLANQVTIKWESVVGAKYYLITLDDGVQELQNFYADDTQITISNLEAQQTYLYEVHAFNQLGSCQTENDLRIFKTGLETATSDLHNEADIFDIYPNPAFSNDELVLAIKSKGNKKARIVIRNTEGKKILERFIDLSRTKDLIKVSLSELQSGLYFVSFENETKTMMRKLVVN